jgi:hypothetical protein
MKKIVWTVLIIVAWVITLDIAKNVGFNSGYRDWTTAELARRNAQVECLKAMWGRPLTLAQLEKIKSLQQDPEAVRAYLLDSVNSTHKTWTSGSLVIPPPPPDGESVDEFFLERAEGLLKLWTQGQTDITKIPNPWEKTDQAALWPIYLTDPTKAWCLYQDAAGKKK